MKTYRFYCIALLMAGSLGAAAQTETGAEADTPSIDSLAAQLRKPVKPVAKKTVSGKVASVRKGSPLAGALVSVVGYDGYSTLSGEDGTFRIEVPEFATSLKIVAPDHNTVHVAIGRGGELMDEVILYSSSTRGKYADDPNIKNTAVLDNLEFSPAISIGSEIGDQLGAYVHSVSRGGTPGVGNYMTINGINSLHGNAQPLVVIDGVILDQQYDRTMIHDGFYNDILANINVNDIEKVEVLTNGTAIYGAKGANGVILIKTKRNRSLATKIDATVSAGITLLPKFADMMRTAQYKRYASDLLSTTGTMVTDFKFLNPDPNPNTNYYYNKYNNETDWNDLIYSEAFMQNYGITVQGGGDVASYNLSVGYTGANSVLKDNDMNRLNLRFNTDVELSKHFQVRFDVSYSNITRNIKDQGAPASYDEGTVTAANFLGMVKSPMLSPYSYVNGYVSDIHYDIEEEDYLDEALASVSDVNYRLANPVCLNEYGTAQNKNYFSNSLVNIAVTPKWVVNKHLNISSLFSYSLVNTSDMYYVPMNGVPNYYVASLMANCENEIRSLYSSQNSITSDTKVEWSNQYGAHSIDLLGGFRYMNDRYKVDTQLGYNTGSDKTPYISSTVNKTVAGATNEWMSLSWYAQARYDYRKRYFVEGDLAIESSSRFGKDADAGFKLGGVVWGVFPSVQAGWLVSNESWFNLKAIDYLKLTAGFDMSGNDGMDIDASRTYFSVIQFQSYLGANGLVLGNIGNTSLQWETSKRFNFGLDMNLLRNRLNVKFNVFKGKVDNLLTLKRLEFISGLEENWSNGGSMENKGFNVSVNAHLLATRNWNWELGASVGHYANKLTALPDDQSYIETNVYGATVRSQVGQPVNMFYGYKTAKTSNGRIVYATSVEAQADGLRLLNEDGSYTYFGAGDVKFANLSDEPGQEKVIDENDMQIIGNPNPDIYGNIFTSVSYKRLRLDVNFNYSLGNDVYNYMRSQLESGSQFFNQTVAMTNRWTYEGQATDMPKASWGDPMGNSRFSDRWIEDGSYLKLKSLTLSYELPINNTYIHGLTFWGQANNLFTLTRYLGADPEVSLGNSVLSQGIDRGLLANCRNFMIGIKINL